MLQKFITVGNSIAVTIPKDFIRHLKVASGTPVHVTLEANNEIRLQVAEDLRPETVIDKEVYAVGSNLLKRYLPAFKELAKR